MNQGDAWTLKTTSGHRPSSTVTLNFKQKLRK